MAKEKSIYQVQGWRSDEGEYPDAQFIDLIEVIDADNDTEQNIIQSLKDKTDLYYQSFYGEHDIDNYHVHLIIDFDLKGNVLYCDEESIHYDCWEHMDYHYPEWKITRTPDED